MSGPLGKLGSKRQLFLDHFKPGEVTDASILAALDWMRLALICAARREWRSTWDRVAGVTGWIEKALAGRHDGLEINLNEARLEYARLREELLGTVMGDSQ